MRQIKFRKWDFENEEMIDGDSLAFEVYAPISELLTQKGTMQYTGLLDDNGKRIYEDDIVEVVDGKRRHVSKVSMHSLGVIIDAHPVIEEITGRNYELLYDYSDYGCGRGITQRCYVLGDIYRNPELLKFR